MISNADLKLDPAFTLKLDEYKLFRVAFVLLTVIKEPNPPVISIYHGNVELVVLYAPNLPDELK
jgi:hypothetical protein